LRASLREEFDEGTFAEPQRFSLYDQLRRRGIGDGWHHDPRAGLCLALSTKAIDAHAAQTLLVMARQLFPHERLGDQYYAAVVEAVDKRAASDPAVRKLVTDGVAQLDAARGIAFVQLSNGARDAVLKSVERGEFFTAMRTATINNLYGNPLVYRFFGFEGSSVEHGGYIDRGFDDIGWLPKA
jgi:hypothetical protein